MVSNRYLCDAAGRPLRRVRHDVRFLVGTAGVLCALGSIGALAAAHEFFVVSLVAVLGMFAVIGIGSRRLALRAAEDGAIWARACRAARMGDREQVLASCRLLFAEGVRRDVRAAALHRMGRIAEEDGCVAEARDFFDRAARAVPLVADAAERRQARAIILARLALAHLALGDLAGAEIVRTGAETSDRRSAAVSWGRAGSLLADIGTKEEGAALLALATATIHVGSGRFGDAVDLLGRERVRIDLELAGPERELALHLELRALGAMSFHGPHRTAGSSCASAWAERILWALAR